MASEASLPDAGGTIADADLSDESFDERDLADAAFEGCTFRDVGFTGTVFAGAVFSGCRFIRCRFGSVDLTAATFTRCDFADEDEGKTGAVFSFGKAERTTFDRCAMPGASFDRTGLFSVTFTGCNLREARFARVDFSRTFGRSRQQWAGTFADCAMDFASLAGIELPEGTFDGSILREAVLEEANLEGASFSRCNLDNALIAGAKLARANLRGASVAGMRLAELGSHEGMMVSADQQYQLLTGLGLDVYPD